MSAEILVIDDEADIRLLLTGILEDEGYRTRQAGDADEALDQIRGRRPDLIVLDIWLQGSRMDGLELLAEVRQVHPLVPVVMISGHGTIEMAVDAIKRGAYDFIEKPFKTDRLLLLVERAIESARLRRELESLKERFGEDDELIGSSPAIQHVRQQIQRVAPTNSRVLITGPAGAGKEIVARLLHGHSARAGGTFVAINCATLDPDRLEEELFGVELDDHHGPRKVGTFERANGGTLLLDEVADMPLATQGKIVRVLQEQAFFRQGGTTRVSVDVRVIASTNRNLQNEITEGKFREDLYYRLNVVPIHVPALASRREDIPLLAQHFMERSAAVQGLPARRFGNDAVAALQTYNWPGNVRQLRNVVEWLLIMVTGDPSRPIGADMLPPEVTGVAPVSTQAARSGELLGLPLREARELFERDYLIAQLNRFDGNISRTAEFVGMERSALHRKLKGLGITISERMGA
ncbi:MAG: sigma-54 dependent transcriptional regulator [Azospirillaceae bacterium]